MSKKTQAEMSKMSKRIREVEKRAARKTCKRYVLIDGKMVERPLRFSNKEEKRLR